MFCIKLYNIIMFDFLIQEYSDKNDKPLIEFTHGSKKKVIWKCKVCSHEWVARIGHRMNGSGCPICSKKKSQFSKAKNRPSILITHPNIAKEWDDDKLDINLISKGSNKKCKWKCNKCCQNFIATPNDRCARNSGCPYCSGRLATNFNRLSIIRPDLTKELLIGNASQLCCNSRIKCWWECQN